MVGNRGWLGAIRRAFIGSSCKTAAVLLDVSQNTETVTLTEEVDVDAREENVCINEEGNLPTGRKLYWEDLAAIKIQACFRGHLARRAFRALRSLVKLQAVVRGVCVRRQARIAVHCMQVLVRLQVRVRARQLLDRSEGLENSRPL